MSTHPLTLCVTNKQGGPEPALDHAIPGARYLLPALC